MEILDTLKRVNIDGVDLEKAIALLAFGRTLQAEYAELELETPDWLNVRLRELRREINTRVADAKEKRLSELKSRRETLETPEVRRKKIDAEIKKLEQEVGATA